MGLSENMQYSLPHSAYHLFSILEMYNSKFGIFFTSVGELDLALHEIFKVFLLSKGELPYEEIIPMAQELQ